uniref:Ovule protein n=1 Tax=Heterorhabditis bacteriophora TaxID=37862 RepID=A0A1I7WUY6_HETBA
MNNASSASMSITDSVTTIMMSSGSGVSAIKRDKISVCSNDIVDLHSTMASYCFRNEAQHVKRTATNPIMPSV